MLDASNIALLETMHDIWDYSEYVSLNPETKIPLSQYAVQVGVLIFSKRRWPEVTSAEAVERWLNISSEEHGQYVARNEVINKSNSCSPCGGGNVR